MTLLLLNSECKPDIYDQVFESFRKVLSKLPSSSNVDTSLPNYSLRKLQFLTSKKEYQRILQIDPNSTFKFSLSLSSIGVQRKGNLFKFITISISLNKDGSKFVAHLSSKIKWAFLIAYFVHFSTNISNFHLLLDNGI